MVPGKLTQADIRKVWDRVRPGLEELVKEYDTDWRPEDVYAFCTTGRASLYLLGEDEGFLVARKQANPFTGETSFFVWAAWGKGMLRDKYMADLERVAREEGASVLVHESKRPAFARVGWEPLFTTYQRRL